MDLPELLLALVALVWVAAFCLRCSTAVGCCLTVLTAAVFGVEYWSYDGAGVAITCDRVVLLLTMIAFVVQWRFGQTDPKRLLVIDKILLAFIALLTVSYFTGDFPHPREKAVTMFRLTVGYWLPTIIYFLVRQSSLTEKNVKVVRGLWALLGVYLGFTAICEMTKTWSLVFPWQIADPNIGLHFGRARGPMVHSVSFGLCLGTCLLATWVWRSHFSALKQRWITLAIPLMLVGILLCLTRSVWIGTGLSTIVLLGMTLKGQLRRAFLAVAISTVVVIVVVQPDNLIAFQREESAENTQQSAELRKSFVRLSMQMIQDKPIWGFGFGKFYHDKMPYIHDRDTELLLEPIRGWVHHNTFLSVLVEMGVVGFVLFISLLSGWGYNAWRLFRCEHAPNWVRFQGALLLAQIFLYIPQLLFHELSYALIDNATVYFMAGLTVGLRAQWDQPRFVDDAIAQAKNSLRQTECCEKATSPAFSTSS